MRALLLTIAALHLVGCAEVVIPKLKADEVHCTYDRVEQDIRWQCTAAGTGLPADIDIF